MNDAPIKDKKLRPGSRAWWKEADALSRHYAPIGACVSCNQPNHPSYCCQHCGSGEVTVHPETGERMRA